MPREMRTVSQIIEIIKNLKRVSTNSEVAKLLGINPRTLASTVNRKDKLSNKLIERLLIFSKKEDIDLNYLLVDMESWMKESQVLRASCEPVRVDEKGRVREYLVMGGDTWELRYIFKMTSEGSTQPQK